MPPATMAQPMRNSWQLLRRYLDPQRAAVLLMCVLLVASIVLQLLGPQIASRFIDAARSGAEVAVLLRVALLFLAVSLVQQGMSVLATYWSQRVAWTATNALRADLAAHLLHLDIGFHTARTPGEMIERVDGDVNALAGFLSSFVVQLIGNVVLLLGILVTLFLADTQLGLAFSLFSLLALGMLSWIRKFATPHLTNDRQQSSRFYGYIGEVLTATEDLRANGATSYALWRFFKHLQQWLPIRRRAWLWAQSMMMAAIAVFAVATALAYALGGFLYQVGAISLGTVYLVLAYAALLEQPIETIRTQIQDLQRADASMVRVRELLDMRPALEDGSESPPSGALSVEFRGVHFGYGPTSAPGSGRWQGVMVLNAVSFHLEAGRVLGLLGRTGSGKTTIARLLFRLYDPVEGEVCVGGLTLRRAKVDTLRQRVGMVTQDVQLFEASLRDNLTFFDSRVSDQHLVSVLETLGLQPWFQRLPEGLDTVISGLRLSAGEAQLVALARVFLNDPGLVILDEASSRLDPATELLLERALDRLLRGRTAIIIAHRLATIDRADDILLLEDGHVLESGPRASLAADPSSRYATVRRTGLGEVLA